MSLVSPQAQRILIVGLLDVLQVGAITLNSTQSQVPRDAYSRSKEASILSFLSTSDKAHLFGRMASIASTVTQPQVRRASNPLAAPSETGHPRLVVDRRRTTSGGGMSKFGCSLPSGFRRSGETCRWSVAVFPRGILSLLEHRA